MKNAPTYEEFRELVKHSFKKGWPSLSDEEVETYLESDEAKTEITNTYNYNKKKLEAGEITVEVFRDGVASGCGYCLEMMY